VTIIHFVGCRLRNPRSISLISDQASSSSGMAQRLLRRDEPNNMAILCPLRF
jgi:hypothetical protein